MSTAVIVGTGLIGASFGLVARHVPIFERVIGGGSPAVVEKAIGAGAVDVAMPLEQALPLADFVLLAQPVKRIIALLETIDVHLRPGTLVSDVGSTKAEICASAKQHIRRGRFVGGHPMAGKESRGPEAAVPDLFDDRTWIVTEPDEQLIDIVEMTGARPVVMDAEGHDRLVALSSHLPQLVSTALASYLEGKDVRQVAGPGLTDMTRLALSNYALWEDILLTNRGNIDAALAGMIAELQAVREALGQGELGQQFERGSAMARTLPR